MRKQKRGSKTQKKSSQLYYMLKLHTKLEVKLVDLESHSGQENMRIYGVPEGPRRNQ